MHKQLLLLFVPFSALLLAIFITISIAGAEGSLSWISSPLVFQKQADTQSVPNSIDGNIDCFPESASTCGVPTNYGAATHNGTVRLNGSGKFYPVMSYMDGRQRFLGIPNSAGFITYTTEPAFGVYLYFNYNFDSSARLTQSFGQDQYQITKPPDGILKDQAGNKLAADVSSMSFSQNGQWMVVSSPGAAMLRVNLQTFEVLPFSPGFDYSLGLDPAPKTAITNNGRYAVVASKNFSRFKIYDLTTCAPTPEINSPADCRSRDLAGFMQQKLPGYGFTSYIRFLDDDTLSAYSTYAADSSSKTARVLISTASIGSQIDYLALGDSYIVGEGAFDYQGGTDTNENACHLSFLAYPYLLGHDLNYNSYHSVACSGAVVDDIINTSLGYKGQSDNKKFARRDRSSEQLESIMDSFKPGYIDQMDFVSRYQPKIINLSIGGNDMGFSDIVQACGLSIGTCYSTYEDRLELVNEIINQVFPRLIKTYSQLKAAGAPDMRFYVIGYPQIAKPGGDCGLNVRLNSSEIMFSQQLISYLDSVVQAAAEKVGVNYVDTQDAFNGHRLCEAGPGSVAMNGLTAGNDRPGKFHGPIGDESYHPNVFGYQLLENIILKATHNLTAIMADPNPTVSLPDPAESGILNAPASGREIKTTEYDSAISDDVMSPNTSLNISLSGTDHALAPSSTLQAEIHSDPTPLGIFTTDASGNISAQINLPANLETGYHTLHFYGMDINGQQVDIYKYIFLASNSEDSTATVSLGASSDATFTNKPATVSVEAVKTSSPANAYTSSQQQSPAGQVLGEETLAAERNKPKAGWLLAALPATISIFYFLKNLE